MRTDGAKAAPQFSARDAKELVEFRSFFWMRCHLQIPLGGQPRRYCTEAFRLPTRVIADAASAANARSRAAANATISPAGMGSAGGIERCAVIGFMKTPFRLRRESRGGPGPGPGRAARPARPP